MTTPVSDTYVQDIDVNRGYDQFYTLNNWQINGVAVDLTGCHAAMEFKRTYDSAVPLLAISDPTDITLSSGSVVAKLKASNSTLLDGRGIFNLKVTFTDGTIRRLWRGSFNVIP